MCFIDKMNSVFAHTSPFNECPCVVLTPPNQWTSPIYWACLYDRYRRVCKHALFERRAMSRRFERISVQLYTWLHWHSLWYRCVPTFDFVHACACGRVCVRTCVCVWMCLYVCEWMWLSECVSKWVSAWVSEWVNVCVFVCGVCMWVFVCGLCMCDITLVLLLDVFWCKQTFKHVSHIVGPHTMFYYNK